MSSPTDINWLMQSATKSLVVHYYIGKGIEKDLEKAFYWYQQAAENGNESSCIVI